MHKSLNSRLFLPTLWLLLTSWLQACGISAALRGSSGAAIVEKDLARERSSRASSLPQDKADKSPHAEEIASPPIMVGGSYLSCSVASPQSLDERLRQLDIACKFDPKDQPAARESISFAFSQGISLDAATPVSLISSETREIDADGKWSYVFHFARDGVRGPFLFAKAIDSSKNPPATYQATLDVREREVFTLVGARGAVVGPLAPWPIGLSDIPCSPGSDDDGPNKLNVAYAWKFEVLSDSANLDLNLKGVCGVSALLSGLNRVSIRSEDDEELVFASLSLEREVPDPLVDGLLLPKGRYQVVSRAYRNVPLIGVFDNVLIGRMTLEVISGRVDMGTTDVIESMTSDASQD